MNGGDVDGAPAASHRLPASASQRIAAAVLADVAKERKRASLGMQLEDKQEDESTAGWTTHRVAQNGASVAADGGPAKKASDPGAGGERTSARNSGGNGGAAAGGAKLVKGGVGGTSGALSRLSQRGLQLFKGSFKRQGSMKRPRHAQPHPAHAHPSQQAAPDIGDDDEDGPVGCELVVLLDLCVVVHLIMRAT